MLMKNENNNNYMSISLPMIECGNCGRRIGHLYQDYYNLGMKLEEELAAIDGLTEEELEANSGKYTEMFKSETSGDNWNDFLAVYFKWKKQQSSPVPVHTAFNLVVKSLLRLRPLDSKFLPFGMNREDPIALVENRYCCPIKFMCDNSRATY
jgi:hypothetical protein